MAFDSKEITAYWTDRGKEYLNKYSPLATITHFSLSDWGVNYVSDETSLTDFKKTSVAGDWTFFQNGKGEINSRINTLSSSQLNMDVSQFTKNLFEFVVDANTLTETVYRNINLRIDLGAYVNFLINEHSNKSLNYDFPNLIRFWDESRVATYVEDISGNQNLKSVNYYEPVAIFKSQKDLQNYQKINGLLISNGATVKSTNDFPSPLAISFSNLNNLQGVGEVGFNFFDEWGYNVDGNFRTSSEVEAPDGGMTQLAMAASNIVPTVRFNGKMYNLDTNLTNVTTNEIVYNSNFSGSNNFKLFPLALLEAKKTALKQFMSYNSIDTTDFKTFSINFLVSIPQLENQQTPFQHGNVNIQFVMDMDQNNWVTNPTMEDIRTYI